MNRRILLIPIGFSDMRLMERLSEELERRFPVRVEVGSLRSLPENAREPRRNQYNASRILRELQGQTEADTRILGITAADIFAPGLSFVFGQASQRQQIGIVSTARLAPQPPEEHDAPDILFDRALKETIHELGHLYGLGHCPDPACIMHFSNSVADTDRKSADFCPICGLPAR